MRARRASNGWRRTAPAASPWVPWRARLRAATTGSWSPRCGRRATRPRSIAISPFLAYRDYHALSRANASLDGSLREERTDGALVVRTRPYAGLPELALHASPGAHLVRDGTWYYSNEYLAELDR